jgi:uncharacterized membrane protein (UPF0136 family)
MIVVALFAVYGLLVELEAMMTFRQTGSRPMFLAGMASGGFMMFAVALVIARIPIGVSIGLGVILAMTAIFGGRYLRSRLFFPSGAMLAVSVITLAVLLRLRS